jgi:hypothetical protein
LAETTATTTTPPSQPGATASAPQGRRLVIAYIALVVALFIGLFTILWYRSWWKIPATPSARFVVEGDEAHQGMEVLLEGPELAAPLHATIRKEDDYIAAFSLPSGNYAVRITRDGRLVYENRLFHLHEYHLAHLPLKAIDEARKKASSRPS